jgi:hypothetical protein
MNPNKLCIYLIISVLVLSCNNSATLDKKYNDLTEEDYEHKADTVDGETVYFKTANSANTPQDFTNLDNTQKLFIKNRLAYADTLISKYQPHSNIDNFTPQTLDSIIDQWNADSSKFNCTEDYFINTIGTAFGHYLVKTYKMKWAMVIDEYGTDYATTIEDLKLTNFPLNSIVKAIEQKREGSLQTISLLTKRQIKEIKRDR